MNEVSDPLEVAITGAATAVLRRHAAALRERASDGTTDEAVHDLRLADDWDRIADDIGREFGRGASP